MNPIILEGPDCAGKTTLARELEKCGYEYIHNGPPDKPSMMEVYYDQLKQAIERPIVIDRFHLGELVYGPLLRGHSGLTDEDYINLDAKIEAMGGIVIICLPTWRQVLDGWAARKAQEHIQQYDQLRESYTQYRRLLESHDNYIHYDYNRFTASSFAMAMVDLRRP